MSPSHPTHALPAPRREVDLPWLRERTQGLLAAHVPLSLLLDLAEPGGPDSAGCYVREGGDTTWLRAG